MVGRGLLLLLLLAVCWVDLTAAQSPPPWESPPSLTVVWMAASANGTCGNDKNLCGQESTCPCVGLAAAIKQANEIYSTTGSLNITIIALPGNYTLTGAHNSNITFPLAIMCVSRPSFPHPWLIPSLDPMKQDKPTSVEAQARS